MSLIIDCSYPMIDEIRRLHAEVRFYGFVPVRVRFNGDAYERVRQEIGPMVLDPKSRVEEIMGMKIIVDFDQKKDIQIEYETPQPMIGPTQ